MTAEPTRQLLAEFEPFGVGLFGPGGTGQSASWPAGRALQIYDAGLYVGAYVTNAWVSRTSIKSIRVGHASIKIIWNESDGQHYVTITSFGQTAEIAEALQRGGYTVVHK